MVGVIGLGPMGAPVAGHIARAGFPVRVWNRTRAKAAAFAAAGHPADLSAEVVLSALPDVDHLERIAPDSVLGTWASRGTTHLVVLSTTSPDKVRDLAARLTRFGIAVVDAPMSGGDAGARAGTLSLMVGGAAEDVAVVEPVLRTFSSTVEHMGPVGAGTAAKLCNQIVVATTLVGLAESLDLAQRAGLSGPQLVRVLEGGLASSAVLDAKAAKILHREYSLGGSTDNQVKDLRYAVALADRLGARLTQTREAAALFEETVRSGLGGADHSAVFETVRL
ncbi:2-hydroxy-3-oxopropionate reductase [Amycolatopsis sulphurea]|uniref:2-hydroxy-3-oxopropionate reductase n=1 Tax=Amycolatopsis sulphurea TaxID=76022 RepID=A0A2A9FJU1_9PSEU|nr:2-hydroxy-3-oxopropionate reductase [Amycolatopsis sulphurea]